MCVKLKIRKLLLLAFTAAGVAFLLPLPIVPCKKEESKRKKREWSFVENFG